MEREYSDAMNLVIESFRITISKHGYNSLKYNIELSIKKFTLMTTLKNQGHSIIVIKNSKFITIHSIQALNAKDLHRYIAKSHIQLTKSQN